MPIQFDKNVPNFLPITAAREMYEPFHRLKFSFAATYYDQMRSGLPELAKIAKFAQGAQDLHSGRSELDMGALAVLAGDPRVAEAPTALAALGLCGPLLAQRVAEEAHRRLGAMLEGAGSATDVVVVDRAGAVIGRAGP